MKVIDASVVVELLVRGLDPARLGSEELIAPHLLDSEVTNVLRRLALSSKLSEEQGASALNTFLNMTIKRFPADWLRLRMWGLRHNLSAYDATYVALTELTKATSLLTTDAKLAKAAGIECQVEVL